jgi:hypothetical protein
MRRCFFIFIGVIGMVAAATSAWSQSGWVNSSDSERRYYGKTNITWPKVLYTVNVDNYGKVTGTGSQVKISHTEPGSGCHKVVYVAVDLFHSSSYKYLLVRPNKKDLNLCNFNERDATFDLVFPGSDNALEIQRIFNVWVTSCQADYRANASGAAWAPYGADKLFVGIRYANKNVEMEYHKVPPVVLNCAPCPPLNVRNSMNLKANFPVTLTASSFASGGIPPYSIKFLYGVPKGMKEQPGTSTWTWTPTLDQSVFPLPVTVRDSCQSGKNMVQKDVRILITDPTPPTLSALSISPSILPAAGGDVVFKMTANDNKAVTMVNAAVSVPGWGMAVPLKRVSGTEKSGVWQGTYKAPANTANQDVRYMVNFVAWDSDGNKSQTGGGVFIVKGKPGGSPPTQYKYKK